MNTGPFINPMFYVPLDDGSSQASSILENNDNIFSIQNPPGGSAGGSNSTYTPSVTLTYNGTGLHTICGATPMMVLGHNFNRTEAGILLSVTNKITLTGKIYHRDQSSSGINFVLGKEKDLKKLFMDCPVGTLEVKCGTNANDLAFSLSGVRVVDISTENSPDFLTKSMGYTINLEQTEGACPEWSGVVSASDSWSIEPVADEYVYETFNLALAARAEYDNPNSRPIGNSTSAAASTSLTVHQIPQFKVAHKLSAKGVLTGSGCNNGACPSTGISSAYLNAKSWVASRLRSPWATNNNSGVYLGGSFAHATMSGSKMYLYNHVRATNFSITEGSYDLTDTWLAMPTGITHTEDYTIDISTDEKYVKTVKVNGTIKGLSIVSENFIADSGYLFPSGDGKLALGSTMTAGQTGSVGVGLDIANGGTIVTTNAPPNRYINALSGWHHGIKPYLYKRASSALNANFYTGTYVPSDYSRSNPLKNPTFSKESLLNVIPWSTSETHDQRKGMITYSYEFNNKFTVISGVITENISFDDTGPNDVVAEVFVIGRRLGPILQSLGAKTSSKRTVGIDITVMPATGLKQFFMTNNECPLWTGGHAYSNIQSIIEGFKPFGVRDTTVFPQGVARQSAISGQVYQTDNSQSWNPTEGRYSRKVTWVYQQCNNSKLWMDT